MGMLAELDAGAFNDWSLAALSPLPTPLLVLLAAGLVAAFVIVARSVRTAPAGMRFTMLTLRMLGLVMALVLLMEPGLQLQQVSPVPGRVAVVLDVSRSMTLPSGAGADGEARMDRARAFLQEATVAFARLPGNITVEGFTLGDRAAPSELAALATLQPGDPRTDITGALDAALAPRPGRALAGVLVISDGADNAELPRDTLPSQLRERLHAAGAPIHVVPVGAERGLRDLAIAHVRADDFAFVRNPLEVDATVVGHGLGRVDVPVTLKKDGRTIAVQNASVEDDVPARVTFKFEPREVGEAVYSVEVPLQPDEALQDNNRRFFTLKVIRDRIRVLQVAGRPSWDERFLRQLLKENPSVDLISFFILRTPSDITEVRPEELSLIPFPTRELFTEELGTFDVVIFQNFNFGPYEMGGYLPNVRQFVLNGGGFAMVGGDLSFSEGGYDSTVLADILPVNLPPGRGHYAEEPFLPALTDAGRRHPILHFPGQGAAAVLADKPPFTGFNETLGLVSGAEALLVHPAPRTAPSPQPLLAVREVGKGRSMALMTDSLWTWSLPDAGLGGRGTAHRELWANAIRWLIGDPALSRVRVEARSSAFDPGEPVVLTVRAFDASYGPQAGAEVQLTLESPSPDGSAPRVVATLKGDTGPDGEWVVRVPPPGPGAYRARVQARLKGQALGADEDAFLVRQADREIAEGAPRPALLRAIAEATNGTVVTAPAEIASLKWNMPEGQRVHRRKTVPLWDRWFVGLVFGALWAAEWVLRRRAGYA